MSSFPPSRVSPTTQSVTPLRPSPQNGGARQLKDVELTLADYAEILRRWWWLVATLFVAIVSAVMVITALTPATYQSSATVIIRTASSSQLFPLGNDDVAGRTMAAEADFLVSTPFLLAADEAAGGDYEVTVDTGRLEARIPPSLITFTTKAPSAEEAAFAAQQWAETYIALRHEIDLGDVTTKLNSLEAQHQALTTERLRVMIPVDELDTHTANAPDETTANSLATQRVTLLQTLNAQLQPIDSQLASVNTEIAQLKLRSEILANPEVSARINTVAEIPEAPVSPRPARNLALGTVVAGVIAVAASLAVASFDDRLRTSEDVDQATGLGALTVVPYTRQNTHPLPLPPGSLVEEAFQRAVSTIDFTSMDAHKVLLVTSAQAGEAKTSTASRLALTLAQTNRRVLVIGGDLRKPTLASALGTPDGPGLGDYLSNDSVTIEHCLHRSPARPGLVVLPAGTIQDNRNPAELLRAHELEAVVNKLRDYCDHIIIDGPPLLPVADGLELARVADAVVLSLNARNSRGRAAQRAIQMLRDAGPTPILGYVFTGATRSDGAYGGKY